MTKNTPTKRELQRGEATPDDGYGAGRKYSKARRASVGPEDEDRRTNHPLAPDD